MIPIRPRRFLAVLGTAAGACAIAVPAVVGLSGNPSFSQRIPVGVPSSAQQVSFDEHGSALTIIDGRHQRRRHEPATRTPRTEPGDDRRTHTEPGDDRRTHTEPGDDRSTHTEPGDDRGGHDGGRHRHGGGDDHDDHGGR